MLDSNINTFGEDLCNGGIEELDLASGAGVCIWMPIELRSAAETLAGRLRKHGLRVDVFHDPDFDLDHGVPPAYRYLLCNDCSDTEDPDYELQLGFGQDAVERIEFIFHMPTVAISTHTDTDDHVRAR